MDDGADDNDRKNTSVVGQSEGQNQSSLGASNNMGSYSRYDSGATGDSGSGRREPFQSEQQLLQSSGYPPQWDTVAIESLMSL